MKWSAKAPARGSSRVPLPVRHCLAIVVVTLASASAGFCLYADKPSATSIVSPRDIKVSISAGRNAGAITSLTFRGVEYVDNFDHGRQIQSAVTLDDFGECLNPTESGSGTDGDGPTTTSTLISASADNNVLKTETRAAYWLAPNSDYGRACGPNLKVRHAQNRTKLSDYRIGRTVTFSKAASNLIEAQTTFFVPESRKKAIFEGLTGYLPPTFDTFLSYDINTRTVRMLSPTRNARLTTDPIVITTPDGKNALGVITPQIAKDDRSGSFYSYFYWPGNGPTAKWACVFIRFNIVAGSKHDFNCQMAIGTVDEVLLALDVKVKKDRTALQTNPIYKFYKESRYFDTLSYSEGARSGYSFLDTSFHLFSSDRGSDQPLYRCYNEPDDDHFISIRRNCEGARFEGQLGYSRKSRDEGSMPLYRFYSRKSRGHLMTTDYLEGSANGYDFEGSLGFVLP